MDTNPEAEVADQDPAESLFDALGDEQAEDTPEAEDTTADDSPETADEPEAEESEEDQPTDDGEEVELDGEKYRVPKKVAEAILRHQDYTRKTQEVAERRKVVEDKEMYLQAREQFLQASFSEAAELQALQSQLAQFDDIDWNTLITEDAQQALKLNFARQQLQSKLAEKQGKLQQVLTQAQEARSQHLAKQIEMGRADLTKRIGKLSEQDRTATWQQGLQVGYTAQEMATIADPRLMHALYKAAKWDALQAAKPQAMKKVAEAPKANPPKAATPPKTRQNTDAEKRLKQHGRIEDLARLL